VAVDNNVSPEQYLDRIYLDTLVHDPAMLDYLVNLMGPERLALGTDYPFPLGELQPGQLIHSMAYDDKVKQRLLAGTALEWLNLDATQFHG
jgi:aminocarboxymuconate-semialdehyde decarboxylase